MVLSYKLGDDEIKRWLPSFAIFFEIRKYILNLGIKIAVIRKPSSANRLSSKLLVL